MPQAHSSSVPKPAGQGEQSTGHAAAQAAALSSEAERVNDAFISLKLQDTADSQASANETAASFQFRAVSPDASPSTKPGPETGGASRKSPLRPSPSRPANRRTRQRPSRLADGAAKQAPLVGAALPTVRNPALNDGDDKCVPLFFCIEHALFAACVRIAGVLSCCMYSRHASLSACNAVCVQLA